MKLALLFVAALCALALLAQWRGRDSRFHHGLSALVSPISERFVPTSVARVVPRPFEAALQGPLGAGWAAFHPELMEVRTTDDGLILHPVAESVWWLNRRGPMLYRLLDGDASVSVAVRARRHSDPTRPPDREWQFAGLILRDPRSDAWIGREDYVFNVVGFRGASLQVETKSTTRGRSRVDAFDWPSGDAELRIDRRGTVFDLSARPDAQSPWRRLIRYERPDLPARLQLGLIVYAYSEGRGLHDLQGRFERFSVR